MKSGHGAPQRAAVLAAVVIVSGLALGGCGSSALPGLPNLTTGSLSPTPAAAPEVKPITPVDRALHIATTSARAQKCGYNFDPARLRESFLAAEPQRGTSPEDVVKAQQSYDFTAQRVLAAIAPVEGYCTSEVTESVKRHLTSALAGNFDPPRSNKADPDSVLAGYQKNNGKEIINPEWLRGDSTAPRTIPSEQ